MKIVRHRRNMHIACSDSEFAALQTLVRLGQDQMRDHPPTFAISEWVRRALEGWRFQKAGGPLTIDIDRRHPTDRPADVPAENPA